MPLISIIIPVYNSEQYLSRLFKSIVSLNNLNEAEIIFVNDGSTDNSLALIQKFIDKYDIGFLVDLPINGGLANARYRGFLNSTGKYLMFIDSDDYVSENHISAVLNYCHNDYDIIINSISEVYQSGRQVITDIKDGISKSGMLIDKNIAIRDLLENSNMCSYFVTKTIKRSLFDYSVFDWPYPYEDVARMHVLFDRSTTIYRFDNPTYYYFHNSSSIINQKKNALYRFLALRERYYYFNDGKERYCFVPLFDSVIDLVKYNKIKDYRQHIKEIKVLYSKNRSLIDSKYINKHMTLFSMFGPYLYRFLLIIFRE